MCNCNNTTTTTQNHVCKPTCPPQEDCTCPVLLNTSCITYDGDDLECANIESGLPLNQTIKLLDEHVCEAISEINASINLINVGEGEDIYAGIDGIGRRKIKRINTDSNILTITPNTDDITFSIDEEVLDTFIEANQKTYSTSNVGTGVQVYKDSTVAGDNTQFNFRTLTSTGNSVTITQGTNSINLEVDIEPQSVVLQEGTNVTITGVGTDLNPYIISVTDNDTIVTLQDGTTTNVNGDGVAVPYSVEIENLQKTINTFPYTLTSNDDKYTIFLTNGSSNVVINVPNGLVNNFSCVFIQEGTGSVTIQQSGTATLLYPSTTLQNIIKGQYYWAMVEKKLTTNTYYLMGSLLPI